MPIRKRCPICWTPYPREINRTCGAPECVKEWRQLSGSARQQAFKRLAESEESAIDKLRGDIESGDRPMPEALSKLLSDKGDKI